MTKFSFFTLLLSLVFLSSCQQDVYDEPDNLQGKVVDSEAHICMTDFVQSDFDENHPSTRATLEKSRKWDNGSVIRIKFLNGDDFVQSKVKEYANQWIQYANLTFVWVDAKEEADIKIGFTWNGDTGSWSYIGISSKYIAQDKPSMNFGWFNTNTPDSSFRSTVLHEFGHALGLKHEHQHPTNPIQWDKPAVYEYFRVFSNWDQARVDHNFFNKLAANSHNYSTYDPLSIMHYEIYPNWTLDKKGVRSMDVLSEMDKKFIALEYPKTSLRTIQEVWVDTGLFTWNYNKTALTMTKLGKQQEYLPNVRDGEQLTEVTKMFRYSKKLKKAPMFNTVNVKNFSNMFLDCSALEEIPLYNTANGTDFSMMFGGCISLTAVPNINTYKGTNFSSMFNGCNSLTSAPSINTSKGTDFSLMFAGAKSLVKAPSLNTSKGTDFSMMFYGCTSLTYVPTYNTYKGTDFSMMFNGCTSLTSVPSINTANGTDFGSMFGSCRSLTSVPNINTSNGTDFRMMFSNCPSLVKAPYLNTSKGTDFSAMFQDCKSLTFVPSYDTSKGTNFTYMFLRCEVLKVRPQLVIQAGANTSGMFSSTGIR